MSTGEIVPLCDALAAEETLVAGKKTSGAHVGGDEMDSEMFWEMKKEEEEGFKVWTEFFSVVSKCAGSYMNSCTMCCCFREQSTAAELLYEMLCASALDEYDLVVIRRVYISLNMTERGVKWI